MSKQTSAPRAATRLMRALIADSQLRLRKTADGEFILVGPQTARPRMVGSATVADLLARGLLEADGEAFYRASAVARSWLVRQKSP